MPLDIDTIVLPLRKQTVPLLYKKLKKYLVLQLKLLLKLTKKRFCILEAPVLRVAGPDTVYPFAQIEDAWLPTPARIIAGQLIK